MNSIEPLRQIIAEQLAMRLEQVKPESRFVEDLGADSLDTIEILMAAEDDFKVEVDDEDAVNALTVADLAKLIDQLAA